jgi:hypothetical protein
MPFHLKCFALKAEKPNNKGQVETAGINEKICCCPNISPKYVVQYNSLKMQKHTSKSGGSIRLHKFNRKTYIPASKVIFKKCM